MFNSFVKLALNRRVQRVVEKSVRGLHSTTPVTAKLFWDTENTHCFNIIESSNLSQIKASEFKPARGVTISTSFDDFGTATWRGKGADEIIEGFRVGLEYCKSQDVSLSDARFNNLTDGLMDVMEKLSDEQLWELLDLLEHFPACDSIKANNFHDIWSALDDMCCWRYNRWSLEQVFYVADKWYKLNLGKICDFLFEVIDRCSRKPDRLTKDQLVHLFFYMNVCRRRTIVFSYESAVEKRISEMTVDDMGIVALGFFKSQTKIKLQHICAEMVQKVKETNDVHEITLCAILKVLRFSTHPFLADMIHDLLHHLSPKVDTYSNLCVLHIALLGTTMQIEHKPILEKAAQRLVSHAHDPNEIRVKDLERILVPMTMFDLDPDTTPPFYQTIFDELHHPRRAPELVKHPRCMPCALQYLAVKNIYSYEFMNRILSNDYISEIYGKSSRELPRELFLLDRSIDIECPDYKGSRLPQQLIYKSAKWMTNYTPTNEQRKLSASDKLVVSVFDTVKQIVGDNFCINYILPHFPKADIIVCRDKTTRQFVQPKGFENYVLGDIMRPFDTKKYEWYAIVPNGWNTTIRNTSRPVGMINMKTRQLQKIGYKPITVVWNEFTPLSRQDKLQHVLGKLGR